MKGVQKYSKMLVVAGGPPLLVIGSPPDRLRPQLVLLGLLAGQHLLSALRDWPSAFRILPPAPRPEVAVPAVVAALRASPPVQSVSVALLTQR